MAEKEIFLYFLYNYKYITVKKMMAEKKISHSYIYHLNIYTKYSKKNNG